MTFRESIMPFLLILTATSHWATHLKHFLRGVFFFQKQLKLLTCYVQHTKLVETEKEISHRFKLKREKKSRAKKMKTLEYKAALRNCNTYMLSPIGVW